MFPGPPFYSNLAMMVDSMKTGTVNGVPVVFVLDEFERFACRKPQTLLYALLDLCQVGSLRMSRRMAYFVLLPRFGV